MYQSPTSIFCAMAYIYGKKIVDIFGPRPLTKNSDAKEPFIFSV